MPQYPPRSILISRTDSIGDVVLTLPLAKALKEKFPDARILFLGKSYTRAVIECCENVDAFIDVKDFLTGAPEVPDAIIHVFPVKEIAVRAKELKIPLRIGTTNRIYHWWTCNKVVMLSRRNSELHEAQLNFTLLKPLGIKDTPSLEAIGRMYDLKNIQPLQDEWKALLEPCKAHLILHPKSQGSAREWGLENFEQLIRLLDEERFQIFISGTDSERTALLPLLHNCRGRVVDITGKMALPQFISFINHCDGLVAASTGPLHIAAALGKLAIGIYPSIRPMHPGRWAPLGVAAVALELQKECSDCRKSPSACHCIKEITTEEVAATIL